MTDIDARLSNALEQTVERFASLVRGVAGRHRLSGADVDEVMQEVRLRLWRAHASPEALEGLGVSYVYRTAMSAAVDLMRRRRAGGGADAVSLCDVAGGDGPTLVARGDPGEELERRELAARVYRAVDELGPTRRAVVRMYLEGYSREEIAELLGWSEAKTRNLLYRGLADLRGRLSAGGNSTEE